MNKLLIVGLLLGSMSCDVKTCYPLTYYWQYTYFKVGETGKSPLGYKIDDPKGELNVTAVDQTLKNVVDCMSRVAPLTKEERKAAMCADKPENEIKSCLTIKSPPVWVVSTCSGAQVFDCGAPQESCLMKGLSPTEQCPCRCRAIKQDFETIITAPNLELLPWEFVELTTGCYAIQNIQRYQECASPGQRPKEFVDSLK